MRKAGEELFISAGAISQRIKKLEEQVGHRLFKRTGSGVELTESGAELFQSINSSFRKIESISAGLIRNPDEQHLVLSTVPSFAASWLVPRLNGFTRSNPSINVSVETEARLVDFRTEFVDLAIRHGLGDYVGLKSVWLMAPTLKVVASPALIKQGPGITKASDCAAYPLLHGAEQKDWALWFEAQGIYAPNASSGSVYADDYLVIRAAISGQGLALVRDVYVLDELNSGSLVEALDEAWPTDFAYYLVGQETTFDKPHVSKFCDWLAAECSRSR